MKIEDGMPVLSANCVETLFWHSTALGSGEKEMFATLAEVAPKVERLFHREQYGLCFEAATAVYVYLPSYSSEYLVSLRHTPCEKG